MENPLVMLMGILRGDVCLSDDWKAQVETIKREAIPVIAVRCDPLPAVLLDVKKRVDVPDLIRTLKAVGRAPEHWVVWCSLLTPDLSIAESFLLVNLTIPVPYHFILRFHLLRHRSVLEAIERTGKLGIFADPETEVTLVQVNVPELREHLAQLHRFQQGKMRE
jgi:hypothetical protein